MCIRDRPMAEMKNLKVEVVRYNPEVDTAPHSAFYDVPYDEQRCV